MPNSNLKLQILIPTVVDRGESFQKLVDCLAPQVAKHKDVEVVVHWNNFERNIGQIRQLMLEQATAEYVMFIDDDDMVVDDLLDTLMPLLDGVDYVGWLTNFLSNGQKQKLNSHSIKHGGWYDNHEGYFRQVVHKNPTRREIAIKARYDEGWPEDYAWSIAVSPHAKTEHFIDREMYTYNQNHSTSLYVGDKLHHREGKWKKPKLPERFRYTKESTSD